ncbi:MAG: hypothetical protein KDA60_08610 [Planctomycetales bacterium]|nr:hypothetical protein [Planctomycetales bacterium]
MNVRDSIRPHILVVVSLAVPMVASDLPGQFDNVINVPPDPAPASIDSDTQLNILDGADFPSSFFTPFDAGNSDGTSTNVEVNIRGGTVGDRFVANAGSQVNIFGGVVGDGFTVRTGGGVSILGGQVGGSLYAENDSTVIISGGTIGDNLYADGTTITLLGDNFEVDLEPVEGLNSTADQVVLDFPFFRTLTGTLSDGTPIAFWSGHFAGDQLLGTVILEKAVLPPIGPPLIDASAGSLPYGIRAGQTLVVDSGGTVGDHFNAGSGSEVSILDGGVVGMNFEVNDAVVEVMGGNVGNGFEVFGDSSVDIRGGRIGEAFALHGGHVNISGGHLAGGINNDGASVRISGGAIGDGLNSFRTIEIFGSNFLLDGQPIPGLEFVGASRDVFSPFVGYTTLTGVLSDGSPFAFLRSDGDLTAATDFFPPPLSPGVILHVTGSPASDKGLIIASQGDIPHGLREGQTLIVDSNGIVPDDFTTTPLSAVVVETGGSVGDNFEAVGATVNILGGTVGHSMDATVGSDVMIAGGTIGSNFEISGDSRVEMSGGVIEQGLAVSDHSTLTISGGIAKQNIRIGDGASLFVSGGSLGRSFTASSGSTAVISGGLIGVLFRTEEGSDVTLVGDRFRLNDALIDGLNQVDDTVSVNLANNDRLTGFLEDGTRFVLSGAEQIDRITNGTLKLRVANVDPSPPDVITLRNEEAPGGVRFGQTLVVAEGGIVGDDFSAGFGSSILIQGGSIGDNFYSASSRVTIESGEVGNRFEMVRNTEFNILGGSVGDSLQAYSGSQLNMQGGVVGERFTARSGSNVNLYGRQFTLDGIDITHSLSYDVPTTISQRDVILSGILADGTRFEFGLNSEFGRGDVFQRNSKLTLTLLVPEPSGALLTLLGVMVVGRHPFRRRHPL